MLVSYCLVVTVKSDKIIRPWDKKSQVVGTKLLHCNFYRHTDNIVKKIPFCSRFRIASVRNLTTQTILYDDF